MRTLEDFCYTRNNHLTTKERQALGKRLLRLHELKELEKREKAKSLTRSEKRRLNADHQIRHILAVDAVARGCFPWNVAIRYGLRWQQVSGWCAIAKVQVPQEEKLRYVYCLRCPIDGKIRYVGVTSDPTKRLKDHCSWQPSEGMKKWFRKLARHRVIPEIAILEQAVCVYPRQLELPWIRRMFDEGHPLLNMEAAKWRREACT